MKELFFRSMKKTVTESDRLKEELLGTLQDLRAAEQRFSFIEDPDLIDSAIYELNSLNARFNALLKKAKLLEAAAAVSVQCAEEYSPAGERKLPGADGKAVAAG